MRPHAMSSGKGVRPPFPNVGIVPNVRARDLTPLRAGGGGTVSKFVCGYMTRDPHLSRPILNGLPPVCRGLIGQCRGVSVSDVED